VCHESGARLLQNTALICPYSGFNHSWW